MEVIALITSVKSLPSFAIKEGFVVTPQITPRSLAFLMSSTLAAVSYTHLDVYKRQVLIP